MRRLTIEEVKLRLYEMYGDTVVIDESTYVKVSAKAKFIDKDYGEWWTTPDNLFTRKRFNCKRAVINRKKTMVERYGCEYPIQNEEIKKQIARVST
jgi:hypothetical protein